MALHPAPSRTDLTIFVGATSYQVCLVSCVRFERDEAFECFISLLRLGVIKLFSSTMPDRPKFGCVGKDSNLRFPGYEPGEMTTSLPRKTLFSPAHDTLIINLHICWTLLQSSTLLYCVHVKTESLSLLTATQYLSITTPGRPSVSYLCMCK